MSARRGFVAAAATAATTVATATATLLLLLLLLLLGDGALSDRAAKHDNAVFVLKHFSLFLYCQSVFRNESPCYRGHFCWVIYLEYFSGQM